ncbi:M48 family metalloprotease [Pseudosulfitobacter koreensis]|uniref:M48 family metalloprotease n=1 Tax=Pseudosulfitobacter koreensis TaxID=2968472 RepID=A0ABT1YXG5_9RHOB|nr:M48 family metalloprotease [Pseudosulfitobacter koreense]MCR8825573.1 M48 family metalloprotease [Pseudosulfitobacter koreense]
MGAIVLMLAMWLAVVLAQPARAIELLRDADVEYGLTQLVSPILQAAGLSPARVKILVVNDGGLNAFVVGNDAIFVNHGLINRATSAGMLQAVLAHEAAHIANGHITRRMVNYGNAQTLAGLGLALAAVAAAAGGGEAATGLAIGTTSAAQRSFLKHTRAEEASADQSGVRFMRAAGADPRGFLEVMQLFRGQEVLAERRQDPYVRSHPLTRDRLRAMEGYVTAYGGDMVANPTADYWFARVKGKISAHTRAPKWTLKRLDEGGYKDVQHLREAIAESRQSRTQQAVRAIDSAIAVRPSDPYFHTAKGDILMDARQFQAAVAAYGRAVNLAPRDALVLAGYGRALLATGNVAQARTALEQARAIDFRDGVMLRDLSVAYAKSGHTGMAALVTAERYALSGRMEDAGIHAKRASDLLDTGSGPWQRAQDVLIASERAEKRKERR